MSLRFDSRDLALTTILSALYAARALRRRRLVGCMAGSVAIGVFVGSYVWMIFGGPSDIFSLRIPVSWPVWAASIVSITTSSLIALAGIGYLLLTLLGRPEILGPLRSRGLKIAAEE
jgi:hypothetical protein